MINNQKPNFNPGIKTAVFYSVPELGSYLVEIHYQGKDYFISSKGQPQEYANIALAKGAAKKEKAVEAYQALDKTYQEMGPAADNGLIKPMIHDFIRIDLT